MVDKTTTVKVQEDGRCVIPAKVRQDLGIDGEKKLLEITVHYDE